MNFNSVNVSNVLTLDLPHDLHLKGNEPNVALTTFFEPYIIFEVPSNILLKVFKPHVWLSGCRLASGTVIICQGFLQNYGGILTTMFFLGLAEAGIFPGCNSPCCRHCWSKRLYYGSARPSVLFYFREDISFLVPTLTGKNRFVHDQLLA